MKVFVVKETGELLLGGLLGGVWFLYGEEAIWGKFFLLREDLLYDILQPIGDL